MEKKEKRYGPLKLIDYYQKMIDGELSKRIKFQGCGYEVDISVLFGDIRIEFTACESIFQPKPVFVPNKMCYMELGGMCEIREIDQLISYINAAEQVLIYVSMHWKELVRTDAKDLISQLKTILL